MSVNFRLIPESSVRLVDKHRIHRMPFFGNGGEVGTVVVKDVSTNVDHFISVVTEISSNLISEVTCTVVKACGNLNPTVMYFSDVLSVTAAIAILCAVVTSPHVL